MDGERWSEATRAAAAESEASKESVQLDGKRAFPFQI
jgi:hypothetical protein